MRKNDQSKDELHECSFSVQANARRAQDVHYVFT